MISPRISSFSPYHRFLQPSFHGNATGVFGTASKPRGLPDPLATDQGTMVALMAGHIDCFSMPDGFSVPFWQASVAKE